MSECEMEFVPHREAVLRDEPSALDVLIRLRPSVDTSRGTVRRPLLRLGLVVDRSGSMAGEKLDRAKEAAAWVTDALSPEDSVSVVTYDERVATIVPMAPAVDKRLLRMKIDSISSGGSTALHDGWVQGSVTVAEGLDPAALNRVILLSDGLANAGETRTDVVVEDVAGLAARGVSTTTVGVGADYNEELLAGMARAGAGNYWYLRSPSQLEAIFDQELRGLVNTLGKDVTLSFTAAPGVTVESVLNRLASAGPDRYRLADLVAGTTVELVARLAVDPTRLVPNGSGSAILSATLEWSEVDGRRARATATLSLPAVAAGDLPNYRESDEVSREVLLLKSARLKEAAAELARLGNRDAAIRSMQELRALLETRRADPYVREELLALDRLDTLLAEDSTAAYSKQAHYESDSRYRSHHAQSLAIRFGGGAVLGDICDPPPFPGLGEPVEAVVNSATTHLLPGGEISQAIHRKGGIRLLKECHRIGVCAEGDAVVTRGYDLPVPWVIHTVCPAWWDGSRGEREALARCYLSCLSIAEQHGFRLIAFPPLGVGGRRFPTAVAAEVAVRTTSQFLSGNRQILGVLFVCYSTDQQTTWNRAIRGVTG